MSGDEVTGSRRPRWWTAALGLTVVLGACGAEGTLHRDDDTASLPRLDLGPAEDRRFSDASVWMPRVDGGSADAHTRDAASDREPPSPSTPPPPPPPSEMDAGARDASDRPDALSPPSTPPVRLIDEPFENVRLGNRGWTRSLTRCREVVDVRLNRDVIQCDFETGTSSPVGGNDGTRFRFDRPVEELTVSFKQRMRPGYEIGQTVHAFLAMSDRGQQTPANSHLSLYFEPATSSITGGQYVMKLQDNLNMNCSFGVQDISTRTETRSVGGCQQSHQLDSSIRPWCRDDPCEGGLSAFTGQSGWTTRPSIARPLQVPSWTELVYYVRLNTPGRFDGEVQIFVRREGEASFTSVFHSTQVMTRTSGPSRDVKIDFFLFGPWASNNRHTFAVRFADLEVWKGDARLRATR